MALEFFALHAREQWAFEQIKNPLADPVRDGPKPEARWQMLNASLKRNQAGGWSMKLKLPHFIAPDTS